MAYPTSIKELLDTYTPEQRETVSKILKDARENRGSPKSNKELIEIGGMVNGMSGEQIKALYYVLGYARGAGDAVAGRGNS